jgi:hypothetical protein
LSETLVRYLHQFHGFSLSSSYLCNIFSLIKNVRGCVESLFVRNRHILWLRFEERCCQAISFLLPGKILILVLSKIILGISQAWLLLRWAIVLIRDSKFKVFWSTELISSSDIFLNGNLFSKFRDNRCRMCSRFADSSVVLR